MAKRTTVRRFETTSVQGEGSFVVLSSLKVYEIRWLRGLDPDGAEAERTALKAQGMADELLASEYIVRLEALSSEMDPFSAGCQLLADHIVDWDWVDDVGERLPLPAGNVEVIDLLSNEESELLTKLMTDGDSKN